MANQNLLMGAVLLETMWRTRKQDLVDLIAPFVFNSVAKSCAPHETINRKDVRDHKHALTRGADGPMSRFSSE